MKAYFALVTYLRLPSVGGDNSTNMTKTGLSYFFTGDTKTCIVPYACLTDMPGFLRSSYIWAKVKISTSEPHVLFLSM